MLRISASSSGTVIDIVTPPKAGEAYRVELDVKAQVLMRVDGVVESSLACPDPPCHETMMVDQTWSGRTIEFEVSDSMGRIVRRSVRIQ
jgi:hypothetical protein